MIYSIKFIQVCDKYKGAGAGAAIRNYGFTSGDNLLYCNFGSSAPQYQSQESTRKTKIFRDADKILNTDIKYFVLTNFLNPPRRFQKTPESFNSIELRQQHGTVVCYGLEHRAAAFVAELDKEQNRQETEREILKILQAPCFTSLSL